MLERNNDTTKSKISSRNNSIIPTESQKEYEAKLANIQQTIGKVFSISFREKEIKDIKIERIKK